MSRTLPRPPKIVDLHADTFVDDWDDYDPNELLNLSIDRLREMMDAAIYWEYTQIQFIHGKGKGVLRALIYKELSFYKSSGDISSFHPSYTNPDIVVVHIGI